MIQAFALPNLGQCHSFQCHSLEKVFETLRVSLNKADWGVAGRGGGRTGKEETKQEEKKERKNGVGKKLLF